MEKESVWLDEVNCSCSCSSSSFFSVNPPNWDNSYSSSCCCSPFESALSSMVSSPTASNFNFNFNSSPNNPSHLMELIGRLGTITNSSPEISPPQMPNGNSNSIPFGLSCTYPQLVMDDGNIIGGSNNNSQNPMATSVQESRGDMKFNPYRHVEFACDSRENSSVSEHFISPSKSQYSSRKRKSILTGSGSAAAKTSKSEEKDKKTKASATASSSSSKDDKNNGKAPPPDAEPPKDYIHVRARRGQATDAHSLAERVRREKISERMKVLQDLVPGCNKVTGKAVMLDEIINYVQSLQRQVEFLSMKLATVNPPRMELDKDVEAHHVLECGGGCLPHSNMYAHRHPWECNSPNVNNNNAAAAAGLPNFTHAVQVSRTATSFWEDDLHSFVQMGFGQNQIAQTNNTHGGIPMKVEEL